jgi:hypothetical protein
MPIQTQVTLWAKTLGYTDHNYVLDVTKLEAAVQQRKDRGMPSRVEAQKLQATHPAVPQDVLNSLCKEGHYRGCMGTALSDGKVIVPIAAERNLRNMPSRISEYITAGVHSPVQPSVTSEPASAKTRNQDLQTLGSVIRSGLRGTSVQSALVSALKTDTLDGNDIDRLFEMITSLELWNDATSKLNKWVHNGVLNCHQTIARAVCALETAYTKANGGRMPVDKYHELCADLTKRGMLKGRMLVRVACHWLREARHSNGLEQIDAAWDVIRHWSLGDDASFLSVLFQLAQYRQNVISEGDESYTLHGLVLAVHQLLKSAGLEDGSGLAFAVRYSSAFVVGLVMYADARSQLDYGISRGSLLTALNSLADLGFRCDAGVIALIMGATKLGKAGISDDDLFKNLVAHPIFSVGRVPLTAVALLLPILGDSEDVRQSLYTLALRLVGHDLSALDNSRDNIKCPYPFEEVAPGLFLKAGIFEHRLSRFLRSVFGPSPVSYAENQVHYRLKTLRVA